MKISNISTKIIATVGPACDNEKILASMIQKGVNIFRLNFSHGTHQEHQETIQKIRTVAKQLEREVGILQDICGPKIRIGEVKDKVLFKEGDDLFFSKQPVILTAENTTASMSYPEIIDILNIGDIFYLADGKIRVEVVSKDELLRTKVQSAGILSSHKGLNFPNIVLPVPILTEKDKKDIAFGIQMEVDFIAISFVSNAQDIKDAKLLLGDYKVPLIAKIEKPEAVENLSEILKEANALMVARGDLGVEVGFEMVPVIQKKIITAARNQGVPVIIATQMLLSMVQSPIATRAEISDVAGAVYDGVDAIMLSDETTIGNFPVEAVETLYKTAKVVLENHLLSTMRKEEGYIRFDYEAIAQSAVELANNLGAAAIISFSKSGRSIRSLCKYRPTSPIWAMTTQDSTLKKATLYWGVKRGFILPVLDSIDEKIAHFLRIGLTNKLIDPEETYVITTGQSQGMRAVNTIFVLGPSEIDILRQQYGI